MIFQRQTEQRAEGHSCLKVYLYRVIHSEAFTASQTPQLLQILYELDGEQNSSKTTCAFVSWLISHADHTSVCICVQPSIKS